MLLFSLLLIHANNMCLLLCCSSGPFQLSLYTRSQTRPFGPQCLKRWTLRHLRFSVSTDPMGWGCFRYRWVYWVYRPWHTDHLDDSILLLMWHLTKWLHQWWFTRGEHFMLTCVCDKLLNMNLWVCSMVNTLCEAEVTGLEFMIKTNYSQWLSRQFPFAW